MKATKKLTREELENFLKGKKILVTGGTGSIGSEIVRRLLQYKPSVIRVYARGESEQFDLQHELSGYRNIRYLVGDVRDKERLARAAQNIDVIFHAAALKHVPVCEYNPFEAVKTNVIGTQNIIDVAFDVGVKRVVFISTDKATNPHNVMGATKLLAERMIAAAHHYRGHHRTIFCSVRFGNVIGSRGSVLPLLKKQIEDGGPVTITDPGMTRFMMTVPDAIDLVLEAAYHSKGGEIFIFKMPSIRLVDMVSVMIDELAASGNCPALDIPIEIIGARPGEKLYEELISLAEAEEAYETDRMFIIGSKINGAGCPFSEASHTKLKRYSSNDVRFLSRREIKKLLLRGGILSNANDKKKIAIQKQGTFKLSLEKSKGVK